MTLVDREIKEQHDDLILQGYDERNVNPTSYDLTIGSILSDHGESDVFTLLPNATVFAKTKEEIHIPDNLCGHIGEKNSRMREGLWVSGPTYFPGHTTFVFLRVRNVSQNEITIKAGDRIAQISFEKLGTTPDHPYNTISDASFNEEDEYRGMGKYTSEYEKRIRPVSDKRDKERNEMMSEGKKMDDDEMMRFIVAVGRSELFDELRGMHRHPRYGSEYKSSYYLKAVRATLCSLGYDDEWVDTTLRDALEHYYQYE